MNSPIKFELTRAFTAPSFLLSLGVACGLAATSSTLAILGTLATYEYALPNLGSKYIGLSLFSSIRHWVGIDASQTTTDLFYFLLPLLAALPYSWSPGWDVHSGYVDHIATRITKSQYYRAKICAVAATASVVVGCALLVSLLICICSLPYLPPDVTDVVYWGVFEQSLASDLLYTKPLSYILVLSLISIAFAAIWAVFVSALSLSFTSNLAALILPFLGLLVLEFAQTTILTSMATVALSPIEFLRGAGAPYFASGQVIAIELSLMLATSCAIYAWKSARRAR